MPETQLLRRAVFLDRDGTICEEMGYVNHVDRLQIFRTGDGSRGCGCMRATAGAICVATVEGAVVGAGVRVRMHLRGCSSARLWPA